MRQCLQSLQILRKKVVTTNQGNMSIENYYTSSFFLIVEDCPNQAPKQMDEPKLKEK